MKKIIAVLCLVVLVFGLAKVAQSSPAGSVEAFEQLKALAGHWETATGVMHGTLDIQLTSGGSVVMERLTASDGGKTMEMVTMYYLDGDQLKLTHYCHAGNQPTMTGTYAPEMKTLTFNFVSATNMKSPNDGHMHHAVYTFVDHDHFRTVWTFQKDQKPAFSEEVTYVRK
jgi:hypothetical protein